MVRLEDALPQGFYRDAALKETAEAWLDALAQSWVKAGARILPTTRIST